MPTLQFKGKNIIWNHHMSVPYHTLDPVKDLDFQSEQSNGNLIVEGDNLMALKALLPQYGGKVKCIYIDPPYNTGEEHWVYNDNVNSPAIKEWIGKEVGKDDLTKHDKWLCMMTPRLKLLRDLLSDDGVMFISIDDNEVHYLHLIMNEIFGEDCYKNTIAVKRGTKSVQSQFDSVEKLSLGHEYVLCYSRRADFRFPKLMHNLGYEEKGKWDTFWRGTDRPTMRYKLFGIEPETGQWRWEEGRTLRAIDNYKKYLNEYSKLMSLDKYYSDHLTSTGEKIDFVRLNDGTVQYYVPPRSYKLMSDNWMDISIRGSFTKFETEKHIDIVKRIAGWITNKNRNDIILDSFAGSGTTAHAVMELNKEDGGNRQYIVVQMPENSDKEPDKNICKDITRERIVRAIDKYEYESGFEYVRIGQALDAETLLKGELPAYEIFAKYVYYLATGEHLEDDQKIDQENYFVGTKNNQDIYLIYDDNMEALQSLALNYEKAESFRAKSGEKKVIVYAPACFLDEEDLQEMKIEFVSIPYNLFSKNQEV